VSTPPSASFVSYQDAGVDIGAADALVERLKAHAASTRRPGWLGGLGGFGGLFEIPPGYRQPVLVSGTDGVGTKLILARRLDGHDRIGIDLVAMCVNDVLAQGAEPLFFLDYFATGRLDPAIAERVVAGIADGCRQAGAALIGGETAEMPDMYAEGDYDLAGFCVGVAEKESLIDGSRIRPGNALLGIASSGPHSNGYSLIRRILDDSGASLDSDCGGTRLADALMAPTRIYARPLLDLMREVPVHGIAHITGGGLSDNIPRMLPADCQAVLSASRWPEPPVFSWLRNTGPVSIAEMRRTFNCGLGLVIAVAAKSTDQAIARLQASGEAAWLVGEVKDRGDGAAIEIHD
jgi:phosphoribosylformylglycinamidine cyclo-ligase